MDTLDYFIIMIALIAAFVHLGVMVWIALEIRGRVKLLEYVVFREYLGDLSEDS